MCSHYEILIYFLTSLKDVKYLEDEQECLIKKQNIRKVSRTSIKNVVILFYFILYEYK